MTSVTFEHECIGGVAKVGVVRSITNDHMQQHQEEEEALTKPESQTKQLARAFLSSVITSQVQMFCNAMQQA